MSTNFVIAKVWCYYHGILEAGDKFGRNICNDGYKQLQSEIERLEEQVATDQTRICDLELQLLKAEQQIRDKQ